MVYVYTKHIRVTYQSIDNLLKTNEALAQFNITSKKLDQSQKAIARTILVLQGASNAFGDTQKTINSLSNQIRVFQGSLANLRLALGDTFSEPFRQALIYVNAFIIALTDIIRMFVDLKTSTGNPLPDGTIIGQMNDELDELEEKQGLLNFDKFNVASSGTSDGNTSITEALTEELNKQISLYEQTKKSMGEIQNKAIEIASSIKSWFVITDEDGNFVAWTAQAKGLFAVIVAIGSLATFKTLVTQIQIAKIATKDLTLAQTLLKAVMSKTGLIIMAVVAALALMYITNEDFRSSVKNLATALLSLIGSTLEPLIKLINTLTPVLTTIINVVATILSYVINFVAWIVNLLEQLHLLDGVIYIVIGGLTLLGVAITAIKIISFISNIGLLITKLKTLSTALIALGKSLFTFMISPVGVAISAVALLAINIGMLVSGWDDMSGWQKAVGIIGAVAAAIMLVVAAIAAFHGTWSLGTAVAAIAAGLVAAGAAIAVFWSNAKKEVNQPLDFSGAYANGGTPRTGSLFYANERGAELLTNFGGQNYVSNQQQVEEMLFRANLRAKQMSNELGGGQEVNVKVAFDINGNALARDLNPYIKTENARGGNR